MRHQAEYLIVLALLFLVGCNVFAAANVTAKLDDNDIKSGRSTEIIVEAENSRNANMLGYFDIVPDNKALVIVSKDDRVFEIKPKETTGEKRYTISASTTSKEQQFEITVIFRDAETHEALGQNKVVLQVFG